VKVLEAARFKIGDIASSIGRTQKSLGNLKRKIAKSGRCIAAHERRTRRPASKLAWPGAVERPQPWPALTGMQGGLPKLGTFSDIAAAFVDAAVLSPADIQF
jgi:hypothetical protein